ncbi:hypothetical protein CK203_051843 [Vitis vinifera]|uniref:Uncharacterized protein n=1 Tax=Vitis vinifera TaxID=29760 RepID=A0A438GUQ3_VITVI|nr:hypothetical protein CK203_051843 [Vitis vinifera]
MFGDQANVVDQFKPNNYAPYGNNVQYSISSSPTSILCKKKESSFSPHQNPKSIHELKAQEGESLKVREVKAVITLRSESEEGDHDSSVDEEPRIVIKKDMMKKNMSPPFLKLCMRGLNVTKKAFLTEQVSVIIQCKSLVKYKDPGGPPLVVPPMFFRLSRPMLLPPYRAERASLRHYTSCSYSLYFSTFSAIPEATSAIPLDAAPTSEPSITISVPEFQALVSTFQTLTATHAAYSDNWTISAPNKPTDYCSMPDTTAPRRDPDPTTSGGPHRCLSFGDPPFQTQPVDLVTVPLATPSSPPEATTT